MYTVDLSTTRDVVPGDDAVIFCYGAMVPVATEAARRVKESRNKDVRVVDLRTLMPLDEDAVLQAARDCGRIVIVQEAPRFCGYGSELSAMIAEHAVEYLEAPIKRVTGFDTPFPNTDFSKTPEAKYLAILHCLKHNVELPEGLQEQLLF